MIIIVWLYFMCSLLYRILLLYSIIYKSVNELRINSKKRNPPGVNFQNMYIVHHLHQVCPIFFKRWTLFTDDIFCLALIISLDYLAATRISLIVKIIIIFIKVWIILFYYNCINWSNLLPFSILKSKYFQLFRKNSFGLLNIKILNGIYFFKNRNNKYIGKLEFIML